jgi:acyl-CoA synthetase (NDP forming)
MVQNMEELVDFISIYIRSPLPKGLQVSIVAYGGGANVTATDACTAQGLTLPVLSPEIQRKMLDFIPEAGTFRSNPVDVTGWVTSPRIAGGVSLLAACDRQINALIFILDIDFVLKQCSRLNLDQERLFGGHSKSLLRIKEETGKPVVCVLQKTGDTLALEDLRLKVKIRFLDMGIPCFPDIRRAAKALAHLYAYRIYRDNFRFSGGQTD